MTAPPDFEAIARKLARDAFDDKVDVHQHAKYIGDALREAYARGAADEREAVKAVLTKHGCSNHGCRVGFYSQIHGAGTNSSCQCIRELFRMEKHEAHAGVRQLQQIFADLREAISAPAAKVKP